MNSCRQARYIAPKGAHVVDLRSDVCSQPTPEMKKAMVEAELGDDIYGDCPTLQEFYSKVTSMFGMEAAMYVPSGTMGNLIGVLAHCSSRGDEVLLGDKCHIHLYEQGGIAQIGGVHSRTFMTTPDGTFDLSEVERMVRPYNDPHQPRTKLICIENTHNACNGLPLPLDFLAKVKTKADEIGIGVHMDGARLLNAAVALKVPPTEITKHVDSVSICLSKAIGAPIGSILMGSDEIVARALRLRKVLGGGMRQTGMLAAAALVALETAGPRLQADHDHARVLAKGINEAGLGLLNVDLPNVQTNIVYVHINGKDISAEQMCERLEQVHDGEERESHGKVVVRAGPESPSSFRLVTSNVVTTEDTQLAVQKICYVAEEMANAAKKHRTAAS